MHKKFLYYFRLCIKHKYAIIFCLLLTVHIFFRFYQLSERAYLGWDQIDSAWAAKHILIDHQFTLQGVPVKGNTGLYMGPLYYYLITPFYFLTNLDPIASPIFAGIVSIFSFLVIFYVSKKLFNTPIALIAIFINTFSLSIINTERTQNGIELVVPLSYLLFYFLYKVVTGETKYIPWLALVFGFSFHVDFTSVFYPIIILFALPFFPRSKESLRYSLISLPLLLLLLAPMIIILFGRNHNTSSNFLNLFHTTFHGFHLRRVIQLLHDAFIQFVFIFQYKILDYFDFLLPILFAVIYYVHKQTKERLLFSYLLFLWIIIPWFILSTYSGELTDSYFSLPRNIFIAILSYFTWMLLTQRFVFIRLIVVLFWIYFTVSNTQKFFQQLPGNMLPVRSEVQAAVKHKKVIKFKDKDPYSYYYYLFTH